MIELILEFLFSIVWEVVLQIIGEILMELGLRTLAEPFRDRRRRHPLMATLSIGAMGALAGWLSVLALPKRLVGVTGVPGVSLILAPVANAIAMEGIGRMLEARTGQRPYMATYWAGGLFAFSMALVRFLAI